MFGMKWLICYFFGGRQQQESNRLEQIKMNMFPLIQFVFVSKVHISSLFVCL